jgi:hypothetical protein
VVLYHTKSSASITIVFNQRLSGILVEKVPQLPKFIEVPLTFIVFKLLSKIVQVRIKLQLATIAQEFIESELITGAVVSKIILQVILIFFSKLSSKLRLIFFNQSH